MNPIENVCGMLSNELYADGKQYDNVDELRESIEYAWERIYVSSLKKLAREMQKRLIECLEKKVDDTHYT